MGFKSGKARIVTGLDVGTTKVCALIGHADENGQLRVLGMGSSPSQGLRRGNVVDIDRTVQAIQQSVGKAEQMAGLAVRDVYVGIAGAHIISQNSKAMIEITNPLRGVHSRDIHRVLDRVKKIHIPEDRQVIDVIPQEFICNDQGGYENPETVACSKLEVRAHLVLAAKTAVQNLLRCVSQAGCRSRGVLLEAVASATAILGESEKHLGVLLLDIGGGTTDVAVFSGGNIQHSGVVPYAGDNITNDIAHALKVSRFDAENIKKKYGCAFAEMTDPNATFDVTGVFESKRMCISRRHLAEVIQARCEEIFELVQRQIESALHRPKLFSGVVLTGGTALMPGLVELAESFFHLPVKVGVPQNVQGMSGVLQSPIYSTGIGLLMHGLKSHAVHGFGNGHSVRHFFKMLSSIIDL
ncbi:MAG: cell division protein FtsA [Candidatus Sumerlaeia bacterium]|nr:cell division protein FtsA [Candidatus Sumerlaeia bacterium]